MTDTPNTNTNFADLLTRAVTEPGVLSTAFHAFHNYSVGNQLLAMFQCMDRGIEPGPIATFRKWKERGRYVRKGEKGIELIMPVTVKRTRENADTGDDEDVTFQRFIARRHWFVMAQTEGEPFTPPVVNNWDAPRALTVLQITQRPFDLMNGNVQGYAVGRTVAISPVATEPFNTLVHEVAHIVLGHTAEHETLTDAKDRTPRNIRELEAEATAMLVAAALGQPGMEFSRGYIQHWFAGNVIPESNARRILKAADTILKSGYVDDTENIAA